ncbi:unnamed protein product [Amoebophrya sp. A25]|nr:unnamed protein product [Amoebophrya sp. A25]|eukprot:GSA25T00005237001.1
MPPVQSRSSGSDAASKGLIAAVSVGLAVAVSFYLLNRIRKRTFSVGPQDPDDATTDAGESSLVREIEKKFRKKFKNATLVEVMDLGGSCEAAKLGIRMVNPDFSGVSKVEQQRQCNDVMAPYLNSGQVHAVSYDLAKIVRRNTLDQGRISKTSTS